MNRITVADILSATNGSLLYGEEKAIIENVSTDSRTIKTGDVFFPITGEVHDAHKFIPQAVKNGCTTIVASDIKSVKAYKNCNIVIVEDTTLAIQKLAKWYLNRLNLKKIAVTGSIGKTSTRDMVYYILSEKYKTGKPMGNFNNAIGVPLTVFTFDNSMEAAVLETGMDHKGEIHTLVDIIRPDIGIITNVGISHIENLGSRKGILDAKLEITDYFDEQNVLVVNDANDMLHEESFFGKYNVIRVGEEPKNEYYIHDIKDYGSKGVSYKLTQNSETHVISLSVPGAHNAINASLAIAACGKFGISTEEAVCGLSKMELTGKRLTLLESNGIKIIDDTYNAAPDSMKSALNTLAHTDGLRRIAILGDMNELGTHSPEYHMETGELAGRLELDMIIAIGSKAKEIAEGAEKTLKNGDVMYYKTKEDFFNNMKELFRKGDVILFKASRAMEFEKIVERVTGKQE